MDVLFTVMRLVRASISSRLMFILFPPSYRPIRQRSSPLPPDTVCCRIHCYYLKFFRRPLNSVTHTFYQHAWHLISIRGKYDSRSLHFHRYPHQTFHALLFSLGICNKLSPEAQVSQQQRSCRLFS